MYEHLWSAKWQPLYLKSEGERKGLDFHLHAQPLNKRRIKFPNSGVQWMSNSTSDRRRLYPQVHGRGQDPGTHRTDSTSEFQKKKVFIITI